MTDLTAAAQAALDALDAVTDDQVREAIELCERFGVPTEHAVGVAAIVAACNPDGAL